MIAVKCKARDLTAELERAIEREKGRLEQLRDDGDLFQAHAQANAVQRMICELEVQRNLPASRILDNPGSNFPTYIDGDES